MKKRQLGNSQLFVSEIGLGTMSLGNDEKTAISIIDNALERGINFLDTADLYDKGLNEEFVGKAIKGKRQKIILATKVGNRWSNHADTWHWDASKAYIKQAVKDSIRRLQTDYIDLYQLHGGTIQDNVDETIDAFEELVTEGVIRYYGISSIRPNVIRRFVHQSNIISVMMQYSLLDRRGEYLFPFLTENNISVIARGPLAKGILTSKKKISPSVAEKGYLSYSLAEIEQLHQQLKATEETRPLEATAIQFALHEKAVGTVITGASSVGQVIANAQTADTTPLTEQEYEFLQAISKKERYTQHI